MDLKHPSLDSHFPFQEESGGIRLLTATAENVHAQQSAQGQVHEPSRAAPHTARGSPMASRAGAGTQNSTPSLLSTHLTLGTAALFL